MREAQERAERADAARRHAEQVEQQEAERRAAAEAEAFRKAEREAALKKALVDAECYRRDGSTGEGLRTLDKFTSRYGDAPGVTKLRATLVREAAERAAQQAAALRAEQQAAFAAALGGALASAERHHAAGEAEEALRVLDAFTAEHGPQGQLAELRRTIEAELEAARRAAQIRELSARAREFLASGNAEPAVRLLREAPPELHISLRGLTAEAETLLRSQQIRREADSLAGRIYSVLDHGGIDEAVRLAKKAWSNIRAIRR